MSAGAGWAAGVLRSCAGSCRFCAGVRNAGTKMQGSVGRTARSVGVTY